MKKGEGRKYETFVQAKCKKQSEGEGKATIVPLRLGKGRKEGGSEGEGEKKPSNRKERGGKKEMPIKEEKKENLRKHAGEIAKGSRTGKGKG